MTTMLKLSPLRGILALPLLLLCLCLLASARPEGGPHRAAAATEASSQQCDAQGPRQDCGWNGIPASECLSKGCCFSQAPARQGELSLRLPSCFRPNGAGSSYSVSSSAPLLGESGAGTKGTLSQLSSAGPSLGPDVRTLDFSLSLPAPDVARLTLGASGRWSVPASAVPGVAGVERRAKELLLKLKSGGKEGKDTNEEEETLGAELEVEVVSSPSFAAVVRRRKEEKNGSSSSPSSSSSSPLLDTRGFRLVFKDQYIELTTRLPEGGKGALYGLGERTSSSNTLPLPRKGEGGGGGDGVPLQTLWTRDAAAADADQNSYGSWPVAWFVSEDSGAASALAMLSSNAIDVLLTAETLTWRLAGGTVDLFVLSGPTPASVARQLASLVGSPTLQPPWAFGAMNSKYGYASAAQCRQVVDSFDAAGVPLEAWVSDSQYMSGDRIFTWGDDFSKSEMRDFVRHLRATGGRRWVPILDPVVRAQRGYAPYDEAAADGGIFVKGADGKPYLGQMWPGAVHWPDFLENPATQRWWTRWLRQVKEDVGAIDGVWLDMNEVSNFCSGDLCRPPLSKADPSKRLRPDEVPPNANFVCLLDCEFGPFEEKKGEEKIPESIFSPPYAVNSAGGQRNLSEKTLPVSARHPRTGALEYDAHNLYGHSMARATAEALVEVNKIRPFLYTRSSFLGTGAFAGHWTGDTSSSWRDLRRLTPSVLQSGLALIPFVGGDVGGFMNGASSELAERWIAAASLHPFFRFHHAQGFQEPFRRFAGSSCSSGGGEGNESAPSSEWGPVRDAARASLGLRYRLLPTLYSAAAQASATGCPTARPLWFLWPGSKSAREQAGPFAVGDALVVAPALEPGVDAVELLLPSGVSFFDFYSRRRINSGASSGATPPASVLVSLPAPRGKPPPLLVVAGGVVAVAGEEGQVFNTTSAARAAPLTLLAALSLPPSGATTTTTVAATLRCGRSCKDEFSACGDVYLDRGDELDPGPTRRGRTLSVDASSTSVRLSWPVPPAARGGSSNESSSKCEAGVPWGKVQRIVVLGAGDFVSSPVVKARVTSSGGGAKPKVDASLGAETGALELTIGGGGLQLKCGEDFEVEWK